VSAADGCAVILWVGVMLYALLAGADEHELQLGGHLAFSRQQLRDGAEVGGQGAVHVCLEGASVRKWEGLARGGCFA